jgi:eukaryotic-like serine/threonine-protein kinase
MTQSRAPETEAVAASNVPENIAKFRIIRELGRGSTGIVYLAHDPSHDREVAMKVYPLERGAEQEQIARSMFLSEARLIGKLQHPHLLPIYDAGEEEGRCYIVTEYMRDARTLAAHCQMGSLLAIETVLGVMFKCARALHHAHTCGVIHRDIKPSNILLTPERDVRIIDFGIALVAGSQVEHIEGIAGSPFYMSPEQVQNLPLTNRSDLYSLGAVMYELLTGSRPFKASNLERLLHRIVYATPPPIHTLNKEVPEDVEVVVAIAMQKNPGTRYKDGLDFAAELSRVHQRLCGESARIEDQA